jgi:glycosyltransferase involved in cell wall biosynthesis
VSTARGAPTLSIVVPVRDEPDWIAVSVADAIAAQQASPFREAEVVIVDDGSGEATREALAGLDGPIPIRVVRQEGLGRFAARRNGIAQARGELVLLVDSRVSIRPEALAFAAERLAAERATVWNAHVDVELEGNPYARFWNVLTEVAFADYFSRPRTTSFGLAEFDRFPKGFTCFLAPRDELLTSMAAFSSLFSDLADANDDTLLIRDLAARRRVNISPQFSCLYRGRNGLRPFLRHAHHRGVVFVDGFLRPGTRFFPALVSFYPLSLAAVALAARRPVVATATAAGIPLAAGVAALALRRPPRDAGAVAVLALPWAAAYVGGLWRGAASALRALVAR